MKKDRKYANNLMSLILLSVFIITSCQTEVKHSFKLDDPTFSEAIFGIYQVTPDEAMEWMFDSTMAVFIDLRSQEEYRLGHLENAINIPTRKLLSSDHSEDFDQWLNDSLTVVLYANSELEANAPWMLMYQLGYSNIRLLQGGYSYIDRLYLDLLEEGESFESELPKYPFAAIIEEVKTKKPEVIETKSPGKKVEVKKVIKKESEGGC